MSTMPDKINHTPGPWAWEYHPDHPDQVIALVTSTVNATSDSYRREDRDILLCSGNDVEAFGLINEADARLIAASPELLAMLKRVADFADRYFNDGMSRGDFQYIIDLKGINALIAKAEGKP